MSKKINDGGPAFPQLCVESSERDGHGDLIDPFTASQGGMTLRDWFAGMALMGMNASPELLEIMTKTSIIEGSHLEKLAKNAFKQADEMLKARSS